MSPLIYGDRWWMVPDESYSTPTAPTPEQLKIPWISVQTTSPTRAVITLGTPSVTPGSYGGSGTTYTHNDPDFVFTTTSGIHVRENLIPGQRYSVRARAYSGPNATGTYGDYIYESFTMPKLADVASVSSSTSSTTTPRTTTVDSDAVSRAALAKILAEEYAAAQAAAANTASIDNKTTSDSSEGSSTPVTPTGTSYAVSGNREVQRSVFRVNNKYKDREKYSVAVKNTQIPTTYKNYAFGAGIFFDSVTINPLSGGGIGFFTSDNGLNGYFVEIQTDSSNENNKDKSVKIFKVVNGKRVWLQDSQDTDAGRLKGGILHSTQYKLDINVSVTTSATVIDVYVNNFKITAADTNVPGTTNPLQKTIDPTANMTLFSSLNATNFDYIYAAPLEPSQYNNGITRSLYSGQYANSTLNFLYGEKLAQNFNQPAAKSGYLEEFGTVARELRYVKTNYAQPAAFPLYASVGVNKFATVLGSRFTNHGAELFVFNNAGTFIPLQSGEQNFVIVGNYVDNGAPVEYTETTTNEYTVLEPAIFQSNWIQNEADAKALFTWIKNQWAKQQQSINMEVFGNPAIEVGDIITVNYPKNGLDGTQKFLVTNVNLGFEGGLSTSITARSIYS